MMVSLFSSGIPIHQLTTFFAGRARAFLSPALPVKSRAGAPGYLGSTLSVSDKSFSRMFDSWKKTSIINRSTKNPSNLHPSPSFSPVELLKKHARHNKSQADKRSDINGFFQNKMDKHQRKKRRKKHQVPDFGIAGGQVHGF